MQNGIKYNSELIFAKLIEAIKNSGLSYGEISKKTGIPKSSIHRYAKGQTQKIPIDAVRLIAQATGVSADWIMGWEEHPDLNQLIRDNPPATSKPLILRNNDLPPLFNVMLLSSCIQIKLTGPVGEPPFALLP